MGVLIGDASQQILKFVSRPPPRPHLHQYPHLAQRRESAVNRGAGHSAEVHLFLGADAAGKADKSANLQQGLDLGADILKHFFGHRVFLFGLPNAPVQ